MGVIYRPKGRAGEYSPLAINHYIGCDHRCQYPCYAPRILHMKPEEFYKPKPKENIIDRIKKELPNYENSDEPILLSFVTDPYCIADIRYGITREILKLFLKYNVPYKILTKGGTRAKRDLDIMEKSKCEFGQTVVMMDDELRMKYEPYASPIYSRLYMSREASMRGIRTWISLEPIISVNEAIKVIREFSPWIDEWKVGLWNYNPEAKKINWKEVREKIIFELEMHHANYYIKEDLRDK